MAVNILPDQNDLIHQRRTFLLLWGIPIVLMVIAFLVAQSIPVLSDFLLAVGYLWIGGACLANAIRCKRTHCVLMGPSFLILGFAQVGNMFAQWFISGMYLGLLTAIVLILSFLPEFFWKKYWGKSAA